MLYFDYNMYEDPFWRPLIHSEKSRLLSAVVFNSSHMAYFYKIPHPFRILPSSLFIWFLFSNDNIFDFTSDYFMIPTIGFFWGASICAQTNLVYSSISLQKTPLSLVPLYIIRFGPSHFIMLKLINLSKYFL